MVRLRALVAALALGLVGLAGCSLSPPQPPATGGVEIAVIAPFTGADADAGQAIVNAVEHVVTETWHGRVEGVGVTVKQFDTEPGGVRDPDAAAHAATTAVADTRVVAAVGFAFSAEAAAAIPVTAGGRLGVVSPAASNPCLTSPDGPGCPDDAGLRAAPARHAFFRTIAPDDGQAAALADYAARDLHADHVATLSDALPERKALAEAFTAAAKKAGADVVAEKDLDFGASAPVAAALADARSKGADGVFAAGAGSGGVCRPRAAMEAAGFPPQAPYLVPALAMTPECLKDAGPAAEGIVGAQTGPDAATPTARLTVPSLAAATAVIAALDRAVKAAGGNPPRRDDVRRQLAADPEFDVAGDPTAKVFSIYRATATGWTWVTDEKL